MVATRDTRVIRLTLAEQIEDALRADIMEGTLVPGERLRPGDLAQQYGVSSAPLREALQRLAAQKLIYLDPRMGATVADVSQSDLRDIYSMRLVLESMALERSMAMADGSWLERVDESWEAFSKSAEPPQEPEDERTARSASIAYANAHRAFHEALFSACDSPLLTHFVHTLYDNSERYRTINATARGLQTIHEHGSIYEPAIAGRKKEALAALKKHIEAAVSSIEEGLTAA